MLTFKFLLFKKNLFKMLTFIMYNFEIEHLKVLITTYLICPSSYY